ncbi:MAG: PDZ domain-containing protein [Proteobacteria bacterium]|nr:PDZ domain-containing protein [Pseudomonadota bacterium]
MTFVVAVLAGACSAFGQAPAAPPAAPKEPKTFSEPVVEVEVVLPAGAAPRIAPQAIPVPELPRQRLAQQDLARFRGMTAMADEAPPWSPPKLQGVAPDPRVSDLVRALGDPDFATRERATAALLDIQKVPDEQVWIHLSGAAGELPFEAHARLLEVARSRILDAPRGALGIQMAARFADTDGVTVTGLIPNMPAQKVLKPGDRIVQLDGRQITVSQQLSAVVQNKRPGDRIAVVVMRGERDELGRVKGGADGKPVERRIEIEMEVGSRADLEKFGDGGMDTGNDTTRDRLAERLLLDFPAPVRVMRTERLPGEPLDVESHPDIIQLRQQLASSDGLGAGAGIRAVLRARLSALEAAARAPGLDEGERAWFKAVADRYRELIPEELRPESPDAPQRK